ncbi:hypothetical protein HCN44_005220 [Aphidius gifuensis]|uniref:Uncharacterized protein n=1 Tax=Aphidius gifuensis TaxID=684658 RepID=A0A834XUA3_APHGI|nr:hypothetical protein HCN44_005220 [Aphidius gifuensis]
MTHSKIQVEDEESRLAIRFLRKRTKKFNWGHHKSSPKDDEIEKQDEKLKGLEIEHLTEAVNSKLEITTSHPEVRLKAFQQKVD